MKTRSMLPWLAGVIASFGLFASVTVSAQEKPKYTIKEVMEAIHKGETNVGKRILQGQGTADDLKKLVEYYPSLLQQEPPRGDIKAWSERVTKLVDAGKALQAGKAGAAEQYKAASNCKACHTDHKPD